MNKLNHVKTEISVIGAGFVGAAHATHLAKFYQKVNLIDRNEDLIERLKLGELQIISYDDELSRIFKEKVSAGVINPSKSIDAICSSNIIFISVAFDFKEDGNNFDNLRHLIKNIKRYAMLDCLVVLETTVPPGTSEKIILPLLIKLINEEKIGYVYSYERVMPGPNYLKSLEQLPKVYAGINQDSVSKYKTHLNLVSENKNHKRLRNIISAELAKVLENTYRMMNIAIVQEFAEISEKIGADLPNILTSIRNRPSHSNIRYAGLAPGGYCLTKDPNFLISSSELVDFSYDFPILKAANKILARQNNIIMSYLLSRMKINLPHLFFGVSYLPGVGDTRGSSSLWMYQQLVKSDYSVYVIDPYCEEELSNSEKILFYSEQEGPVKNGIIATRHPEFTIEYFKNLEVVFDINSCLSEEEKKYLRNRNIEVFQYGENL